MEDLVNLYAITTGVVVLVVALWAWVMALGFIVGQERGVAIAFWGPVRAISRVARWLICTTVRPARQVIGRLLVALGNRIRG